ncbi:DUF1642 domain-containing protein [Streptococcus infantarius]
MKAAYKLDNRQTIICELKKEAYNGILTHWLNGNEVVFYTDRGRGVVTGIEVLEENMNKQEVIKGIEEEKYTGILDEREDAYNNGLNTALSYVKQLDEPEKVVVPQFVADWYENNKYYFEYNLYRLCTLYTERKLFKELDEWFDNDNNKPIETLVLMHKFGYEVKKEKLYTVKFSNEDFGKIYIGIFKKFNKLGISSLPLNDDEIKSWFTEDELKRFKFWDNPAFEINEVEEVSRLTDGAWNTLAELNETEVDE